MNYYFYLFVIVWIKPYIIMFESVICHIAKIWKAQSINNNNNDVNNAHNMLI